MLLHLLNACKIGTGLVGIPASQSLIPANIVTRKHNSLSYLISHFQMYNLPLVLFPQVAFDFGTPSLNTV